jgi:hypothetical protein
VKPRRACPDAAPRGVEWALPSRELRLARTPAPVRPSLWKRAVNWIRGRGRGPATV